MNEITLPQGTIRYMEIGSGPVIVFVHGALTNGSLWHQAAYALSKHFRCIVPNWPLGSHRLPMAPNADLTPHGVAKIVADFLAALDLDDVILVGNDSGGAISQLVCIHHPQRIGKLVLTPCDAFDRFPPPAFAYFSLFPKIPGMLMLLAKFMYAFPGIAASRSNLATLAKHGFDREQLLSWLKPVATNRAIRRDLNKFIAGMDKSITIEAGQKLPQVRIPALLLWAAEDRHFPPIYGERLRDALGNARLVVVDDSYAFLPLDQPARLADEIASFAATSTSKAQTNAADKATVAGRQTSSSSTSTATTATGEIRKSANGRKNVAWQTGQNA